MKSAKLIRTMDLGAYGGAETFFADINNDGLPEIITYQGPGIFGARSFRENPKFQPFLPCHTCVSAFDLVGRRLWSWGEPNPSDPPYLSHGNEDCVTIGDIDGDGQAEVVVALGDALAVLDGASGREKRLVPLLADYYYIIHALGAATGPGEAALVAKNSEGGADPWACGQPVLGLNSALEVVWGPRTVPGGGHHILTITMPDGQPGYLIGYCALHPKGTLAWMVDAVDPEKLDARLQHVDFTATWLDENGRRMYAMAAGTPYGHVLSDGGGTLFSVMDKHVQGVAVGRFDPGGQGRRQAAFYNCHGDTAVTLYDMQGQRLWRRNVDRLHADMTIVDLKDPGEQIRRFHRNRPLLTITGNRRDWIGFADGGWPWGMDGAGEVALRFPAPAGLPRTPWRQYPAMAGLRLDDLGFGYALKDLVTAEDQRMTVVYNRRYLWVYDSQVSG
ncbi:MAG: hypothetical protein ABR497_00275 [Kiritimatiellia bacterium]|nr:hypothetical protein [Lentisphaerota bacterium]